MELALSRAIKFVVVILPEGGIRAGGAGGGWRVVGDWKTGRR